MLLSAWLVALQTPANVVLDWNVAMMAAIRTDTTGPTLSSRNLAILNLAIYDAVSAVLPTHQPYRFRPEVQPGTSAEAAAAAAGYDVLKALYPSALGLADATFAAWRDQNPADDSTTRGIALGRHVARLTLDSRSADGSSTEVPYIPSSEPGQWRRTPPSFRPPLTPHWRYVTPFTFPDTEPFVPDPPPPLNSEPYAEDLNLVKTLGQADSAVRTAEQSHIAVFWSDFNYTSTPPGHWHEIAATIVRDRGTTLEDTARLMALISLAQADAAIVCWEAKYRYNFWRPITAIQRAEEDENLFTEADPAWDHYLAAPPFPAYPSGHSTFSHAAAVVLRHFFDTDAITFVATSDSLPGVTRTFHSLTTCADEVGMSRVYGGIHFLFDNRAGKSSGQQVAHHVTANFLLPHDVLPLTRVEAVTPQQVNVRVHGQVGTPFALEASPDLSTWTSLTTGLHTSGGVLLHDVPSNQGRRFYRVRGL